MVAHVRRCNERLRWSQRDRRSSSEVNRLQCCCSLLSHPFTSNTPQTPPQPAQFQPRQTSFAAHNGGCSGFQGHTCTLGIRLLCYTRGQPLQQLAVCCACTDGPSWQQQPLANANATSRYDSTPVAVGSRNKQHKPSPLPLLLCWGVARPLASPQQPAALAYMHGRWHTHKRNARALFTHHQRAQGQQPKATATLMLLLLPRVVLAWLAQGLMSSRAWPGDTGWPFSTSTLTTSPLTSACSSSTRAQQCRAQQRGRPRAVSHVTGSLEVQLAVVPPPPPSVPSNQLCSALTLTC